MGLRPTTKKVNGRWYDINQAADRIAELEQQVEALKARNAELVKAGKAVLRNKLNIGMLQSAIATAQQEGEE